jgi:hypothetical protein
MELCQKAKQKIITMVSILVPCQSKTLHAIVKINMEKAKYYDPQKRPRAELETMLASSEDDVVCDALLDAAYFEEDWRWVQQECLGRLASRRRSIRCGALYGLQLLGFVRKEIEPDVVIPAILELRSDPEIAALADEVIADIYQRFPPH